MKFLKNLFRVDPGAGPMEKFVTYFVPLLVAVLLIWLFGSCWGIFENDISRHAQASNGGFWGTLLLLAAIFWAWWNWTERIPFKVNDVVAAILLMLLIVFSVFAYTGFFHRTI